MKKTATLDQEAYSSRSAAPSYSYSQALDLLVRLPCGEVKTIRSCSSTDMRALVSTCVLTARDPKRCESNLEDIDDYQDTLTKWFCVLEMRLAGCSLPIVKTWQEEVKSG